MSTQKTDHLITGGLVVTPRGISKQDILVNGETIQQIGPDLSTVHANRVIDASGKYVLPGIIDAHCHPGQLPQEQITSSTHVDRMDTLSISQAFGGITTAIPFVKNRRDEGIAGTAMDMIQAFIEEGEQTSILDFGAHAILVGDDDVADQVPKLIKKGVISFKMFMTYPGMGIWMPDDKMIHAMNLASADGGCAMVHAENGYCIDYLVNKFTAEGKTAPEYYAQSQPRILEVEAATRAATYATVTGCPTYIVHLSAREILDVLSRFKSEGLSLYGETCPQYLDLTNKTVLDHGALGKIGPPLREKEDNEAMWVGLANHLIDTVGSDFCGYKKSQKYSGEMTSDSANIFDVAFGGNWAEQMLPVVYHEGVNNGRITLPRLVQVMCENPAKIFGLYPKKGVLQPGSDADIVLFDPTVEHTLSAESQHCEADFTMFEGKEVLGKPVLSMQRGEIIIEDGELKRSPGKAKFLPGNSNLATYAPKGHKIV